MHIILFVFWLLKKRLNSQFYLSICTEVIFPLEYTPFFLFQIE